MIVHLRKIETTPGSESIVSLASPAESSALADNLATSASSSVTGKNRKLRNWLIVANVGAWIAIVFAIRLIFF